MTNFFMFGKVTDKHQLVSCYYYLLDTRVLNIFQVKHLAQKLSAATAQETAVQPKEKDRDVQKLPQVQNYCFYCIVSMAGSSSWSTTLLQTEISQQLLSTDIHGPQKMNDLPFLPVLC